MPRKRSICPDQGVRCLARPLNAPEHIETLNSTHERAILHTAEEIKALSELTAESQSLIEETATVIGLIKNVADQTRMLGIMHRLNRQGLGITGGDSGSGRLIHKLSASTLQSVNSVTQTMATIGKVLQNIDQRVSSVVEEVQKLEENQRTLTHERTVRWKR